MSFTGRLPAAISVLLVSLLPIKAPAAPQTAAGIQYEVVGRPQDLSDDFKISEKANLKFLSITSIDRNPIDAAWWQPQGKSVADTTVVVMVHGSGGNFRRPPESALGARLAVHGYAALAINTRQHDNKINTENFFDVRRDIEAAVYTARSLGYKKLVLQGHSLGNIQVQFYAATNWDQDIKAALLLAPFGNLPWKTRNILVQNEDGFARLIDAAKKSMKDGVLDQPLPVRMRYFTGKEVPVTAQHFFTYRWDKTSIADGTIWIKRVPLPVLIIRDQADLLIQPFEPYMLLDAAHSEGSLVKSIDYMLLKNDKAPSLKGHYFDGNEQSLADSIVGWLKKRDL